MARLTREKLEQASQLVESSGVDVWLTFVRETAEGGDPVLPLILDGGLTWLSALMVARGGERVAIVGNFDADIVEEGCNWTEVVPYVQSIREPLLNALDRLCGAHPRIAVNYSEDDVKSDGLTHGMYRLLERYLAGTRFEGSLESASGIVSTLRAVKTPEELARIRKAIDQTIRLYDEVSSMVWADMTEMELYREIQEWIDEAGFGYSWARAGNPIVNFGPESFVGHGMPTDRIRLLPGQILHLDMGLVVEEYSSDIQRCWYVTAHEEEVPSEVQSACDAVNAAIGAAAKSLRPGVQGWEVDAAARKTITELGYPEYLHAVGHQVGRVAHDGGTVLAPRWERYGATPMGVVREREVYTLELGVTVPRRGFIGIEEMVVVTSDGCKFLTPRMTDVPLVRI